MSPTLTEALRLGAVQALLALTAVGLVHGAGLALGPTAAFAVAALGGVVAGAQWSSGSFDGPTPWGDMAVVVVLGSIVPGFLWFPVAQVVPVAPLLGAGLGAALGRVRWIPRLSDDEDPAAAWARTNAKQYKEGRGDRLPDTVSLDPYGMITGGRRSGAIQDDPFERAIPLQAEPEEPR